MIPIIDCKILIKNLSGGKYILNYGVFFTGNTLSIMEKSGVSFCQLNQYNEDNSNIYLGSLSVNNNMQHMGNGKELFQFVELVCNFLKAESIILAVQKDSLAKTWYERMGFTILPKEHEDNRMIWMEKFIEWNQ